MNLYKYRHSACGRLSRIKGECEECMREEMAQFWVSSPLPCGHNNSGIPFNKSWMGVCDLCEAEWRNISLKKDEERKQALKKLMFLNKKKNDNNTNN